MKSALINNYIKLKSEAGVLLDNIFGDQHYKKFVIISDSRTGSTLLRNLLNFHSQIIAEGERFKVLNGKTSEDVWRTIFRSRPKNIRYVGFKLFYFHPTIGDKKVWEILKDDPSVIIIHLKRENILRSLVSKKIGLKTKMWTENINTSVSIPVEEKKILLKPEECNQYFEEITAYQKNIDRVFGDREFIPVTYEDLANNRVKVLERIAEKWNLIPFQKDSELKKQNPEKLEDLIINFKELSDHFENSKWKKYFIE